MSDFTTTKLTGERVLVRGTDRFNVTGETVVDSSEWTKVQQHVAFDSAQDAFNQAVEEFFAPLMLAADQVTDKLQPKVDPISYITVHEGTEAVEGRDEVTIKLGKDSIVLRLLEQGEGDRLVWVNGELEVLEVEDAPAEVEPTFDEFVTEG